MRGKLVLTVCLALALAVVNRAAAQTQQPSHQTANPSQAAKAPFSISISTPASVVTAGSDVIVNIALTNTSDREIILQNTMVSRNAAEFDYWIDVRDEKGKAAPQTKYGIKLKGDGVHPPAATASNSIDLPFKPGETVRPRIVVNKLFDLSQPGAYTIQVSRFDPESGAAAHSNIIKVTITQSSFSLNLSPLHNPVTVGEEVRVKVILTNASDHDIHLFMTKGAAQGEFDNEVEIQNEQGTAVPLTRYYLAVRGEDIRKAENQVRRRGVLQIRRRLKMRQIRLS
jgi:hypothetical protein